MPSRDEHNDFLHGKQTKTGLFSFTSQAEEKHHVPKHNSRLRPHRLLVRTPDKGFQAPRVNAAFTGY